MNKWAVKIAIRAVRKHFNLLVPFEIDTPLLHEAFLLAQNDALNKIIDKHVKAQSDWVVEECTTKEQLMVGRASILAISGILDEINRLSNEYLEGINQPVKDPLSTL